MFISVNVSHREILGEIWLSGDPQKVKMSYEENEENEQECIQFKKHFLKCNKYCLDYMAFDWRLTNLLRQYSVTSVSMLCWDWDVM